MNPQASPSHSRSCRRWAGSSGCWALGGWRPPGARPRSQRSGAPFPQLYLWADTLVSRAWVPETRQWAGKRAHPTWTENTGEPRALPNLTTHIPPAHTQTHHACSHVLTHNDVLTDKHAPSHTLSPTSRLTHSQTCLHTYKHAHTYKPVTLPYQ